MLLSDTAIFSVYWLAVGVLCGFVLGAPIGATWMRERTARRRLAAAAAVHRDLIGHLRRIEARRKLGGPSPATDECLHGSAS